jgi:hypothetical protein
VLRLTLLDNISGLRWKHSNDAELRSINVEPFLILDNSQVALPPPPAELFVIHRQKLDADKILTWIGLYRAVPSTASNRNGDYCGVGFWLLNNTVTGSDATRILRQLMTGAFRSIQTAARQSWDVARVPLDGIARNLEDPALGDLDGLKELGREAICIDASGGDALEIDETLDEIQADRFDRFARVLVSRDSAVVDAIESRGRIPIKKLAEITRPAPVREATRIPEDRSARSRPLPRVAEQTATKTQVSDGSNELVRLSYEVKQANARIGELSGALSDLEARGRAGHGRSWPWMIVAALAVGVAAVTLVAGGAPDFSGLLAQPDDRTAPLQAQIADLRSQVGKLQEALAAYKSEKQTPTPAPARTPPGEGADLSPPPTAPPATGGSPANPPLPPVAPRPVPTISAQDLAAKIAERSTRSGSPFVLVDVDGTGRERLPGAQLCLPIARAAKDPRCTEKDLIPLWSGPDASTLIFYGHDSGLHSPAADLASELAGIPNVVWYRDGWEAWRKTQPSAEEPRQQ